MALAPVTSGITDIIRRETVAELSLNSDVPYRATLAEAVAEFEPGRYFKTDDKGGEGPYPGVLWIYQRTDLAPFYAAMVAGTASTADIDAAIAVAEAAAAASVEGASDVAAAVQEVQSYGSGAIRFNFAAADAETWTAGARVQVLNDTGTHTSKAGDFGAASGQTPNSGWFVEDAARGLVRTAALESEVAGAYRDEAAEQAVLAEAAAAAAAGTFGRGPKPIDSIPSIFSILWPHRVVSTSTGNTVRLRRSSDNAERDFAPLAGTDRLDTSEITTWLAGATAFTRRINCQRFASRYAEQATSNAQPSLTISGSDVWFSFTNGKNLSLASVLDFAQFKDGVTVALVGRIPGAVDVNRELINISRGTGAANSGRASLTVDTSKRLRVRAVAFDDISGYNGVGSEVAVGSDWFAVAYRVDYRGGSVRLRAGNDAVPQNNSETSYLMTERVKSDNKPSIGARINGHITDTGIAWDCGGLLMFDTPLSDEDFDALWRTLVPLIPGYSPPVAQSTIWLVGDSQVAGNTIVLGSVYQPNATYADRPGAVLANDIEAATGRYRYVHQKGSAGATSTSIRNSFISSIVPQMTANDVLYIQLGQNNDLSTAANRQVVLDDIAAMVAASPTTKIIIGTLSYWRSATAQRIADQTTLNNAIMSTWPNYGWDMAAMMATYGGNTSGRTPDVLLWRNDNGAYDGGHRGVLGTKVEYSTGHDGQPGLRGVIAARGY